MGKKRTNSNFAGTLSSDQFTADAKQSTLTTTKEITMSSKSAKKAAAKTLAAAKSIDKNLATVNTDPGTALLLAQIDTANAVQPKPASKLFAADRPALVSLAKEFNKVLHLTIGVKAPVTADVIQNQIMAAADKLVSTDFINPDAEADTFTADAVETLKAIGVKIPQAAAAKPPKAAGTRAPRVTATPAVVVPQTPEEIAAAKLLADAATQAVINKKAADKQEKADKKAADKAAAKAAKKEAGYTRADATIAAVNQCCTKPTTLKELGTACDLLFCTKNGKAVSGTISSYLVAGLVAFNVLVVTDGKYSFPVPAVAAKN